MSDSIVKDWITEKMNAEASAWEARAHEVIRAAVLDFLRTDDYVTSRFANLHKRLTALERGEGKAPTYEELSAIINEAAIPSGTMLEMGAFVWWGRVWPKITKAVHDRIKHAPPTPAVVVTAEDVRAALADAFMDGGVTAARREVIASALTAIREKKR